MNETANKTAIDVCSLTRELIDIPSVTGEEGQVGKFLANLLVDLGYEVECQTVEQDRKNIIAVAGNAPCVFLSTHMDTVPPFIPAREDDRFIHGRGACDAKGIIAAQIAAAERLRFAGHEIGLLFTVAEETDSRGAKQANMHPLATSCQYLINGEPTDNLLAAGTKGSLQATIRAQGRAAHSAYPEEGESAIEKLLDVLDILRRLEWPGSETFGETTCNVGIVSGGTRSNVVPAEAHAVIHVRLACDAAPAKDLLLKAIGDRATIEFGSVHDPQRLWVVDGFENTVVRFTTDVPYLANWGRPLLLGPGSILTAHTDDEKVKKDDLLKAVALYEELVHKVLAV